jgi:hypothetical protein
MSKGVDDIFAFVINFLRVDWQPKHILIGLFEAYDTSMHALAKDLTRLLNKYDLRKKNISYVKDEGFNLNIRTTTLKSIISCDILGLA